MQKNRIHTLDVFVTLFVCSIVDMLNSLVE